MTDGTPPPVEAPDATDERWAQIPLEKGDRIAKTTKDLAGARFQTEEGFFEAHAFTLGVTPKGQLSFGWLLYSDEHGKVDALNLEEHMRTTHTRIEDLGPILVPVTGRGTDSLRLLVSDYRVVVDEMGWFRIRFAQGVDLETGRTYTRVGRGEDGAPVPLGLATRQCKTSETVTCTSPNGCAQCTSPPGCDCEVLGERVCIPVIITQCRGGLCELGTECTLTTGPGTFSCDCR